MRPYRLITDPRLGDAVLVRQRIFYEPVAAPRFGFADFDPLNAMGRFPLPNGIHKLPFSRSSRAVRIKEISAVVAGLEP